MPDRLAYKVLLAAEAEQLQRERVFRGSPVDVADGYIHLSCGSQLAETVGKHFKGVDGLWLATVDLARMGDAVRWEPSRGGHLFPHIYGVLPMDAVLSVLPLTRSADGTIELHGGAPVRCGDGAARP